MAADPSCKSPIAIAIYYMRAAATPLLFCVVATVMLVWLRLSTAAHAESMAEARLNDLGMKVYRRVSADDRRPIEDVAYLCGDRNLFNHVEMLLAENCPFGSEEAALVKQFGWLVTLDLSGAYFGGYEGDFLSRFGDLSTLDVSRTEITDSQIIPICRLKKMRHLSIHETLVSDVILSKVVSSLPLVSLSIGPGVLPETVKAIDDSKTLQKVWIHTRGEGMMPLPTNSAILTVVEIATSDGLESVD